MDELGDALLGLGGGLGVPSFFGFQAYPAVVACLPERFDDLSDGQIAIAEQTGEAFPGFEGAVLEVDVHDVLAQGVGGGFGAFATSVGMFDVPEHAGLVGRDAVEEIEHLIAGCPGVVCFEEDLAVMSGADFFELSEVPLGHTGCFGSGHSLEDAAAEDA